MGYGDFAASGADQGRRLAFVVAILFATSACAEDMNAISQPNTTTPVAASDVVSKWEGNYEPLSRACEGNVLTIHGSKFSWPDCKDANVRSIAISITEFAFEVDPNAKCGWSGTIVRLTADPRALQAIRVNVYRSLKDYQENQYIVFCAYSKNF